MATQIIISSDVNEVISYVRSCKSYMICDIETTSLSINAGKIICIALAAYDRDDALVWWPETLKDIQKLRLKNAVFHNAHFDAGWLTSYGAKVRTIWDTMIMAHLLDENNSVSLKSLGQRLLGYPDWTEENIADLINLPKEHVTKYVVKDVLVTRELLKWQRRDIRKNLKPGENPVRVMQKIMIPALSALHEMETNMLPVRVGLAKKQLEEITKKIDSIESELNRSVPARDEWPDWLQKQEPKWGNTNWTKWWLYVYQGAPIISVGKPTVTWPDGAPSLAREVLTRLDHPAAASLVELSTLRKTVNTFLLPVIERSINGRVPTSFNITGTVTGRISSSSPGEDNPGINSQQIPRDKTVRNLFGEKGMAWIECDYSQLELRVAAVMADEPTMISLFKDNEDIHTYMARKLTSTEDISYEQRTLAKGVNFGFLYGMHATHFANYLMDGYGVIINQKEAEQFREEYFNTFNGLPKWYTKQRKTCLKYGGVPNAFGRFRHLPKVYEEDYWIQENAFRQAINAPVQSTGSDFMLISLSRIARSSYLRGLGARLITTVHDSVELTAPYSTARKVAKEVKRIMELADDSLDKDYLLKADATISRCWGGKPLAEY